MNTDTYLGNNNEIIKKMNERRLINDAQILASDIKSNLHDLVRKKKTPHITKKLEDLKEIDLDFYNYIHFLESLYFSIWCDNCQRVKTVEGIHSGDLPSSSLKIYSEYTPLVPPTEPVNPPNQSFESPINQLKHPMFDLPPLLDMSSLVDSDEEKQSTQYETPLTLESVHNLVLDLEKKFNKCQQSNQCIMTDLKARLNILESANKESDNKESLESAEEAYCNNFKDIIDNQYMFCDS